MPDFSIRSAREDELPMIQQIISNARAFMRANGNMTQWTGGYPSDELLLKDIRADALKICLADGAPCAVFALCGLEETYKTIEEGAWPDDRAYLTVHRLACAERGKGAGAFCLRYARSFGLPVRADTHRDNLPMQRLMLKNGFSYCGVIHLLDGAPRLAYQAEPLNEPRNRN